jgi:hypothetical protein
MTKKCDKFSTGMRPGAPLFQLMIRKGRREDNSFYIGWLDFTLSSANGEVSIYDDRAN